MAEATEAKRVFPAPDTPVARSETDTRTDPNTKKRRSGRRARGTGDGAGTARYFLGKPCKGNETPKLGEEVDSEARALLMGYKGDKHLFLVTEYQVTEVINQDKVGLAKQPVTASPRVSNVNRG
ncbi:MAG: hypothetical protein KIT09_16025 [Bryobacteraceae bacterium]|nr:hypothetical protein [Bryobacteraceae bacterium]